MSGGFVKFNPRTAEPGAGEGVRPEPNRGADFSRFSCFSRETTPPREKREAWSRVLLHYVSATIARWSPPGLGRTDEAWARVEGPSKALLDRLQEWEDQGTEAARIACEGAAESAVSAWREAGEAFLAAEGTDQGARAA